MKKLYIILSVFIICIITILLLLISIKIVSDMYDEYICRNTTNIDWYIENDCLRFEK